MIVVTEKETGAQLYPDVHDERVTISSWGMHLACDADLRAKTPIFAALAEALEVRHA